MKKALNGLTLMELITILVIFLLFTFILFNCLIFGIKYSNRIESKSDIRQVIIKTNELIMAEFRQALNYQKTKSILSSLNESSIYLPNPITPSAREIIFTIPNFSHFPSDEVALEFDTPESLQTIRYFIQNSNSLVREQIDYGPDNGISLKKSMVILLLKEKKLQMNSEYFGTGKIKFTITVQDNVNQISFSSSFFSENQ